MSAQEGLRHIGAVRQQLRLLASGGDAPGMVQAVQRLDAWADEIKRAPEATRQPLTAELHR